jgi:hypothetical protein
MANHGWQWVRQASLPPNRCAVFPHINSGAIIDTGMRIEGYDPHVYIGEVAAKELGKMAGMVPKSVLDLAQADERAAQDRIRSLEARVAELEEFKAAVTLVKAEINA